MHPLAEWISAYFTRLRRGRQLSENCLAEFSTSRLLVGGHVACGAGRVMNLRI